MATESITYDYSSLWVELIQNLKSNPPLFKPNGLKKKLSFSGANFFKGRNLLEYLEEFLTVFSAKNPAIAEITPCHTYLMAERLLITGVIVEKDQTQNEKKSKTSRGAVKEPRSDFSLRKKYIVDKIDDAELEELRESLLGHHYDNIKNSNGKSGHNDKESFIDSSIAETSSLKPTSTSNGNLTPSLNSDSQLERSYSSDHFKKSSSARFSFKSLRSLANDPSTTTTTTTTKGSSELTRKLSLPGVRSLDFLTEQGSNIKLFELNSLNDKIASCKPPNYDKLIKEFGEEGFPQKMVELRMAANAQAEKNSLTTGMKVPVDFQLVNKHGHIKKLSDYLARGPVLLNFLIGGDCTAASHDLQYYEEIKDYLELSKCSVVCISPETPVAMKETIKRLDIHSTIYLSDVGFHIFKEFGCLLEYNELTPEIQHFLKCLSPHSNVHYGYTQNGSSVVFPPYYPVRGTFIIDKDMTIRFQYNDFVMRPEPAKMIQILNQLNAEKKTSEPTKTIASKLRNRLTLNTQNSKGKNSSGSSSISKSLESRNSSSSWLTSFMTQDNLIVLLMVFNISLALLYF
eukprot:Awhi_evm1s10490